MKQKAIFIGIVVLLVLIFSNCTRQSDFPVLKGPYLGQKPPGLTPEIFAPGIISYGFHEHHLTISPYGAEMFYVMTDAGYSQYIIISVTNENNRWAQPKVAHFSGEYFDMSPSFSPDGKRLYFTSQRSFDPESGVINNMDIWMVEKSGNFWREPVKLGSPINTENHEVNPSVSADGTLYFQANYEKETANDIYFSCLKNEEYSVPVKLGNGINTEHNESCPFIAPDESYLLFHSNRTEGFGSMDIYVSFKQRNGSWGKPINLGKKINSPASDYGPYISPDSKYLFFTSYRTLEPDVFKEKSVHHGS